MSYETTLPIIFLHHAGGSSPAYIGLRRALAPFHDLVVVDLPGRGLLSSQPVLDSFDDAVSFLVSEVYKLSDSKPYVLGGHSLGGVLAFAVTQRLLYCKQPLPQGLILSACCPPDAIRPWDPRLIDADDDDTLIQIIKNFGRTPPEVLADPGFADYLLKLMRGDIKVLQAAIFNSCKIDIPCALLVPINDSSMPRSAMEQWSNYFLNNQLSYDVEGDHFGILNAPEKIAVIMKSVISKFHTWCL
ncbi:alpha/beta fold hydrolase [Pseudomonas syringae]|uniref:thioesterase II family protein n=1 Tax=Pseudomonas syringae TaxID=317 RepID=UPI0020BD6DE3|nr:alpha/beta fold hydrolase [Pseudomonas syringae]MCL6309472.1 alpha/beta fold hydrolase [Pseudomonas syringae]